MSEAASAGRPNQRRRTRKDLLEAAARLAKHGRKPSLEEVAEAALVSRATAYRYFPSIEALLLEAQLDIAMPAPNELFKDGAGDALSRVLKADAAVSDMIAANEPGLRLMLAQSLERKAAGGDDGDIPARQNRRTPLIEAALAPSRKSFARRDYEALSKALAIIIGTEAMVVCKDVLQLSDADAREVRRWAIRALVEAAEARGKG